MRMNAAATPFHLRRAEACDAASVAACVEAAYFPWIARVGRRPAPMQDDYAVVIDTRDDVTVAVDAAGTVIGVAVIERTPEGLLLENVAVLPAAHGRGVGKALLLHAESVAQRMGYASLYLYTNAGMTENILLYAKIGYVEYTRFEQDGHPRVFMRKTLPPQPVA